MGFKERVRGRYSEGRNVQLGSEELKTTTTDLRRVIDIIDTLNCALDNITVWLSIQRQREGRLTYSKPSAKIELIVIFCRNGNCNFHTVCKGKMKMHISIYARMSQVLSWAIDTGRRREIR